MNIPIRFVLNTVCRSNYNLFQKDENLRSCMTGKRNITVIIEKTFCVNKMVQL